MTHRGKVKYFDADQGYGYIVPADEPLESVFVSIDALEDDEPLEIGQWVEYDSDDDGAADNVRVTDHESETVTA